MPTVLTPAVPDADAAVPAAEAAEPARFHVVINPGSGAHDADEKRDTVRRVLSEAGRAFDLVPVANPQQLEAAAFAAAQQAARQGGVMVAVGGDGTLNTVAQAAWMAGCPLGVVPQGTFNYFGRAHGISQDAESALRGLLRARAQPVQVGQVNGRLFLVNASLGLYPQLLQDRETFKQQLGRHRWVAVLSGLVTLFEWRRQLRLDMELDGVRTQLTTPTLFVGNNRLQVDRIGLDADVREGVGKGGLAAVALKPIGSWPMLVLALRGALGRLGEAEQVIDVACRSLSVRLPGRRRVKIAIDGEVGLMTQPLLFQVAPRPLMLMMPPPEERVSIE